MTETTFSSPLSAPADPALGEAWQMVLGRLRPEMSKALFDTWVEPLRPLSLRDGVVTIGAKNPYALSWVESRLKSSLARLFEGVYNAPLSIQLVVDNGFASGKAAPPAPREELPTAPVKEIPPAVETDESEAPRREASPRKVMLQRAYGSRRAQVVQPERGMFLTLYFFNHWLPLLGHSASIVILAARSLCYWNPQTGELRNTVETDMAEIARHAAVSVRTVKDVLAQDLVQRYFIRYRVRRLMTPNGVRTAGIILQVRMDDPLTPLHQQEHTLPEEERWYSAEFEKEED